MRVPETRLPDLPGEVGDVLDELLDRSEAAYEVARVRGGAAWDALRGERVGPPVAAPRWPVAVLAAVAGAVAAAGIVTLLQRLRTQDPPGAQEPEELEAVVDRPGTAAV